MSPGDRLSLLHQHWDHKSMSVPLFVFLLFVWAVGAGVGCSSLTPILGYILALRLVLQALYCGAISSPLLLSELPASHSLQHGPVSGQVS